MRILPILLPPIWTERFPYFSSSSSGRSTPFEFGQLLLELFDVVLDEIRKFLDGWLVIVFLVIQAESTVDVRVGSFALERCLVKLIPKPTPYRQF